MWFRERRALSDNLAGLLETALSRTEKLVDWMRIDAAVVRYALKNGGDAELTVPNNDLR
jgi:hypothetical protein